MADLKKDTEVTETGLEIAVIGMAGRFPGARNITEFWNNLKNGVESITFFSTQELEEAGCDPLLIKNPNYVKAMGYLQDIEYFDGSFFGYSPMEIEVIDPQMRIFHECAWEALEDAGYEPGSYPGRIGFYSGGESSSFWETLTSFSSISQHIDPFILGNLNNKDYLSTHISYKFNLRGPTFTINTACSTSLVAIHLAVQGVLNGECEIALAGGVRVSITGKSGYLYQDGMINSPDGHCRAFDSKAKGTVSGNGVGIVVLKPLAEAAADGDNIYAVIKGSAINNDGIRKVGFHAPSIDGQAEVISAALYTAEVEPESIGYIETHGTGTELGDTVEIEALKLSFNFNSKKTCAIGSVKTNIGHLGSAAGVAGFIKTVLVLKHRLIPPSLHFEKPNPKIDFENSPFYVNTHLKAWQPRGFPLRAGVSSFGIGGANAHIVLETVNSTYRLATGETSARPYQLLLLSARTHTALEKVAQNLAIYLKENPGISLADTAYTLHVGRKRFAIRRKLICRSETEAITMLTSLDAANNIPYSAKPTDEKKKIVFMFPGLGPQYVNMGAGLYRTEPIFRKEMDRCFTILKSMGFDHIREILYPGDGLPVEQGEGARPVLERIDIAQIVIFIFEYALAKLVIHWGITPNAMIGYSFGEYTAACLAGVFSLEAILKLLVIRGKLISQLPAGMMLSVPLPVEAVLPVLPGDLSIGIDNGSSCVVSGPIALVESFAKQMKENKLLCTPFESPYAAHSQLLDPILEEFKKEVANIPLNYPQIPYISSVTGDWITIENARSPEYWAKQLRATVYFVQGIRKILEESKPVFLEMGPGRDMSALVNREIMDKPIQRAISLIRPRGTQEEITDEYYLLDKIGRMWLYGVNIDWQGYHSDFAEQKRYRVSLPAYPFERQRYWKVMDDYKAGKYVFQRGGTNSLENAEFYQGEQSQVQPPNDHKPEDDGMVWNSRPQLSTLYMPPQDDIQRVLVSIWQRMFGIKEIGVQDDFFELGGDSLKAINVLSAFHKETNRLVPLNYFFDNPTIKQIAAYSVGKERGFVSIQPVEKKDYYPLSSAQKRLFILSRLAGVGTIYNIPGATLIEGDLDKKQLNRVFNTLIKRHETLRTSFELLDDEPIQRVHPPRDVEFEIQQMADPGGKRVNQFIEDFIRPFDLSRVPLIRAGLIEVEVTRHILVFDMHHIITDGTSLGILIEEFSELYNGRDLSDLRIQYKDFSEWQNCLLDAGKAQQQEMFWLDTFQGEIPVLNMPLDYPRPPVQSFEGARSKFELDSETTHRLKQMVKQKGLTLYIHILAAYNVLMARYTGQEDIIVGSHVAGRPHIDLEKIIGMFVNPLPIRNYPVGTKGFDIFLQEVKENALQAYENQDYPYDELLDKLEIKRDPSRNPLFDTALALTTDTPAEFQLPGMEKGLQEKSLTFMAYAFKRNEAKFDIVLEVGEHDETIEFIFEYCTKLFKIEKIRQLSSHFLNILRGITKNPQLKLTDIEMLTEEEKQQILVDFNATETQYHDQRTIHELFSAQAEKSPHQTAVVFDNRHLSYKELNSKANQLARMLRGKGVKSDKIVGVMMERSLEMVISILGILKAGGAYLPCDPTFPMERFKRMLDDSHVSLLLTQTRALEAHSFTRLQGLEATENTPYITAFRQQITEFDRLPIPDRSMVDYEKYNRQIGISMGKSCITMQATRGCPFHCAYCHKLWPKKHVARSAENIFEEVQLYYNMGIRRFAFIDDIFNFNIKNSRRFLELVIKNKLAVQIYLCLRGDILSKDYIDLMVEAGVLKLALALETASPRLQKKIGKNLDIEILRENTHYVCQKYPQVIIDLMTMHGFPTETPEEAMMTLNFIKEQKWLHFPYVHILKIYPNTDMERIALENNISREAILKSAHLAYHELPETLPFDKSFTLKYQAEFTNEYFLSRERLLHVLPYQMKILTEDEFVQKYNSYLPTNIRSFNDFLNFTGISREELGGEHFQDEASIEVAHFNKKLRSHFPVQVSRESELRILLLDLSQYFTEEVGEMLYDVVEQPLGLMYLMSYLKQELGDRVHGKIAKSRIDFNNYEELKRLVEEFNPHIIGIRTLALYKDFFHKTTALLRQWCPNAAIISGGPYATSDYSAVLQDHNIDLVVSGEGEITFNELVTKILENGVPYQLPRDETLKEIRGLAFIPGRHAPDKQFAREIILIDHLIEELNISGVRDENLLDINQPSDLAYTMFTSGSTGVPKGVMIEHRNAVNVLEWFGNNYGLQPGTHVLQISDYTFDPSVEQIFSTLLHGATLFILRKELILDQKKFAEFIEKYDIHIINFIPSFLHELLGEGKRLKSLRAVIPGGEKLTESVKNQLLDRGYPLYNHYGPTETTIDALAAPCSHEAVYIGKPIANTRCYIMDRCGHLVPIGVSGELYIAGAGVSRGYLNNPELTVERFNRSNRTNRTYILYKTGDLARWLPDGNIEFMGRVDNQVKIRGYRIEPQEIEAVLKQHPSIQQVVVLLQEEPLGVVGNEPNPGAAKSNNRLENTAEFIALLDGEGINPEIIKLYLDEIENTSWQDGVKEKVQVVRNDRFEIMLRIYDDKFIRPPHDHQQNWHIQRALEEFKDDLFHLDKQARRFVVGSKRELITGSLKNSEVHFEDTQLIINDQQVMQDWQHPLMKKMAEIAAESHGDVLEIGFGMGISASYIMERGVKSYTVVECNEQVVDYFQQWRKRYPGENITLIQGKWQDVTDRLGQYDSIFFDTYPLDEEEYYEYVINSITFAEHFFPTASRHLRSGGVFTYYTNEIDTFSRRHQRLVLEYFDAFSLSVVKQLKPPPDCKNWWADSMVAIKAVKG